MKSGGWSGVHGKYGLGECNEAGEQLLEFCAVNEVALLNTCFAKKESALATGNIRQPSRVISLIMLLFGQNIVPCVWMQE